MAKSQFHRDASGRLCFEMFDIPADEYPAVAQAISEAFDISPNQDSFVAGHDLVSLHFQRGDQIIDMAWDNWSGFFVTALNRYSEPLVEEIGDWLNRST